MGNTEMAKTALHITADENWDSFPLVNAFLSRGQDFAIHLSRPGVSGYDVYAYRQEGLETKVETYWLADCNCP